MKISENSFGMYKGTEITEYTLKNAKNVSVSFITYGAIITKISMPDKNGQVENITVNFNTLDEMVENRPFHGAIIGRVSGRINQGKYVDNQTEVQLDQNEENNNLHGGFTGLDTKVWKAQAVANETDASIRLTTISLDGEAGFPGNLEVAVTYSLNDQNEFSIQYEAKTDKRTLFNPTNHVYFNLNGDAKQTIHNHDIQVDGDRFAVLNDTNIPTGELRDVAGTDFDLRKMTDLASVLNSAEKQIADRNGLDHPFVLNKESKNSAAVVYEESSGRQLTMHTDLDAVVIYTHNIDHDPVTKGEETLKTHSGLTLETCFLPDAVNQDGFGNIFLEPEEIFHSATTFTFEVK